MRYEMRGDQTHIFTDDGEDETNVLRAIVRSSFESAPPNPHVLLAGGDKLTNRELDSLILPVPRLYDDVIVEMNNVHGRLCSTVLCKIGHGHFVLSDKYYRTKRGDPRPMLDSATLYLRSCNDSVMIQA
jgi:hypothetical protein